MLAPTLDGSRSRSQRSGPRHYSSAWTHYGQPLFCCKHFLRIGSRISLCLPPCCKHFLQVNLSEPFSTSCGRISQFLYVLTLGQPATLLTNPYLRIDVIDDLVAFSHKKLCKMQELFIYVVRIFSSHHHHNRLRDPNQRVVKSGESDIPDLVNPFVAPFLLTNVR